ncbi:MAG: ParB/RepB/Spo0J family partition protein [Nitrospirae bacterium]|nr:ParB/RepB/Spo0J family partition protein [Nitrospirota bacterium]
MKTALGRGLDALLPEKGEEIVRIEIEKILPGKHQPRKNFKDETLKELSLSIKEKGVLQPVIVSRSGDGTFRLIAGERRWRAAALAGLKKIPVMIKDVSSQDAVEIALIENIQREDLNSLEMAETFQRLLSDFKITQEELSSRVGKDRATIANYLRTLKLPDEVKALLVADKLSIGHAKALLTIDNRQKIIEIARTIAAKGLSVRAAENLCKGASKTVSKPKKREKLPEVEALENRLTKALGTKVRIHHKEKRGRIEIEYYSLDELDRLLEALAGK